MFKVGGKNKVLQDISRQLQDVRAELGKLSAKNDELSKVVETATARPRGIELLRNLGVTPDRFVERWFESLPDGDLYEALIGGSEPLRGEPARIGLRSSLCRQIHFSTDEYRYWIRAMARVPRMHRKDWEWFYISQALFEHDLLRPGKRGLVFAVGQEPLPSLFASLGCEIVATDQAPEQAVVSGWAATPMYSSQVDTLFDGRVCAKDQFDRLVSYRSVDMNAIDADLDGQFDFCWSSCAFEHLGSLEHGLAFVENSIRTLAPGGIAVHTTEFNLSSNDDTMETPGCSIYRRRDIEDLVRRLEDAGHRVEPLDWTDGRGFAETVVDLPPYKQSPHLRLNIAQYDCTSIALIIRKDDRVL